MAHLLFLSILLYLFLPAQAAICSLRPLGAGRDDTDQVESAIKKCGHFGTTTFEEGSYNITRKMTWNLISSKVDLRGSLSFNPDIQYWLNANNTYRVVFIQNQASWFVVTGSDFEIDAHNTGGIQGNGQAWWSYYATRTRLDGDGRPISLTLWKAVNGVVRNFRIESPPFWSNTVAQSNNIVYDGMFVNATNTDPLYKGKNIVPNTDGINTFRSDNISLMNWDVTCGDDCLAIKGNSTNLDIRNIICRGGNGIAIGSLGQYVDMPDIVRNVHMQNLQMIRLSSDVQPNMVNGVYLKTWDGTANGVPPTAGGGANGSVTNIVAENVSVDRVTVPIHLYQTNGGHSGDAPSSIKFQGLSFINWTGTAIANKIVDIECSPAVGCDNISFAKYSIAPPTNQTGRFICQNTTNVTGLSVPCTASG